MESEDAPRARLGIKAVGEAGLDAGRLVGERKRIMPARQAVGKPLGVLVGLDLDAGEGGAGLLGLDHPGSLAVNVEEVVGEAVTGERKLADRHPARRMDVGGADVLHGPAGRLQQAVDLLAGFSFGLRRHKPSLPPTDIIRQGRSEIPGTKKTATPAFFFLRTVAVPGDFPPHDQSSHPPEFTSKNPFKIPLSTPPCQFF